MTQVHRMVLAILTWICLSLAAAAEDVQALLDELARTPSAESASTLENRIWAAWINGHASAAEQSLMRRGMRQLQGADYAAADSTFTDLIALNASFTEAWNKRATVRFMMGDLAASERDVAEVLAREPRHFGALSGLAMINLVRHDFEGAAGAYEDLLSVNPWASDARELLPRLHKRLGIEEL